MPPKKKGSEPSKKTVEKKKDKVIEDKTFGMKNKKGKKQQQFIKTVTQQIKFGQQSGQKRLQDELEAKKKKETEKKEKAELASLFKPSLPAQKLSAGADPKSVLCLFFKQGCCTKGDKCKFSHDLSLEGRAEKRSMYVDSRDLEEDTIDKWDEEKLKEVVEKKHGDKVKPKTDIVCKHFLQAIEDGKYGWFWECPSREKCIYRHALPPGFVFKTKKAAVEDEGPKITVEQLVEEEREKLISSGKALTKVTLQSFMAWKKRKLKDKHDKEDKASNQRKKAFMAGKVHGISGREMFEFNPELVRADDFDAEEEELVIEREKEEGEDETVAVDLTNIGEFSGAMATPVTTTVGAESDERGGAVGGADPPLPGAVGGATNDVGGASGYIEIDEDLFTGDVPVDEELFDIGDVDIQYLVIDDLEAAAAEEGGRDSDNESVE